MQRDESPGLLIVEDDLDLAEMLSAYFDAQGYAVTTTPLGEQALRLATEQSPDLILLDIRLPDIDGFEVSRRLRASHRTRYVPIIFLTERGTRVERLQGLEIGLTDYVTKPFDIQELRLRVYNTLRRTAEQQGTHPVTGLPEPHQTLAAVIELNAEPPGEWSVLIVHLRGMLDFRETYGFIAGDDVLRVIGLTLSHAVNEVCEEMGFCGHLDEDIFLLAGPTALTPALRTRIAGRLHGSLEVITPATSRGRGEDEDRLALAVARITTPLPPFDSAETLKRVLLDVPRTMVIE